MDVSSFLSGNFLTHLDLPAPLQVWTIQSAAPQLVGTDKKICISFAEHPKPLGCNKTNLTRIAELYGTNADAWRGRQLQVYRSTTSYSGKVLQCIRVCGPGQVTPEAVCDVTGAVVHPNAMAPAAPIQQPAAVPAPAAPMAAQQQQPSVAVPAPAAPVAVQQQPAAAPAPVQAQPVAAPAQQQPAAAPWELDL